MFIKLLKEVGRGKRGARDLTYEEALEAAQWILNRKAAPAQIGAFLIAERIKMESVAELQAFVDVCRSLAYRAPIQQGIDCSGPYDGRKKSFYASFATAFVLAAAGLPVTLHGSATLPPKRGVTLHDIIGAMGADLQHVTQQRSIELARETGVLYVPAESWCPPLAALRDIREDLDMRTILNTVEKLIDYSCSPYLVFGVFHNTVFNRMSELMQHLGYKRALIVQGMEGSEDMFIDRPTLTYVVDGEHSELRVIDPELYGLETPVPEDIEWTAHEQLRVTEEVLQGGGHIAFANQVLLNSAARLTLAGVVDSIEQGLYICKPLIESGEVWQLYTKWKQALLHEELKLEHKRH